MFQTLYKKCLDLAAHKSSNIYLGLVSFIESSFFPIPPDVMIVPMVIAKKKNYIKIFLIASIFSVLGGVFGYLLGSFFYDLAFARTGWTSSFNCKKPLLCSNFSHSTACRA